MDVDLSEISVILGQKNSGKSVLFEHLLTQTDRYICLDPNAEHGPPGAVYPETPAESLQLWMDGHTQQIIREMPFTEDELNKWCRVFGQLQRCYLYIDEAHNWMSANYIPEVLQHLIKWHVTHSNCGIVVAAHKAKEIHDQMFTQTDNYFIFSYGEHEDAKFNRVSIPDKHRVTTLDPDSYQFLYYKDVAGADSEIRGPVPIPVHLK
jgi:hypothetical protein